MVFAVPTPTGGQIATEVSCGGGSWQYEVGWTLTCSDGVTLSGGATYYLNILEVTSGATCSLAMTDSYGDGWNGNTW